MNFGGCVCHGLFSSIWMCTFSVDWRRHILERLICFWKKQALDVTQDSGACIIVGTGTFEQLFLLLFYIAWQLLACGTFQRKSRCMRKTENYRKEEGRKAINVIYVLLKISLGWVFLIEWYICLVASSHYRVLLWCIFAFGWSKLSAWNKFSWFIQGTALPLRPLGGVVTFILEVCPRPDRVLAIWLLQVSLLAWHLGAVVGALCVSTSCF